MSCPFGLFPFSHNFISFEKLIAGQFYLFIYEVSAAFHPCLAKLSGIIIDLFSEGKVLEQLQEVCCFSHCISNNTK